MEEVGNQEVGKLTGIPLFANLKALKFCKAIFRNRLSWPNCQNQFDKNCILIAFENPSATYVYNIYQY